MKKSEKLSVLVLEEDNLSTRMELAGLKKLGINSRLVATPDDALLALHRKDSDLVIVNLDNPGFDPLVALRLLSDETSTPVCATSMHQATSKIAQLARLAGAVDFIEQPLRGEDFVHRLKQISQSKVRSDQRSQIKGLYGKVGNIFIPIDNISTSGLHLNPGANEVGITLGSVTNIQLLSEGLQIDVLLRAKVVRCDHRGLAFQFLLIDEKARNELMQIIEHHRPGKDFY